MIKRILSVLLALGASLSASVSIGQVVGFDPVTQCKSVTPEACAAAQAMGRGINMGNMLEAPREGDWGIKLEPRFIDTAATVFKTVRIPVRWSNHAAAASNAKLDEVFAQRVDGVIDAFLAKGMYVIIDVHHYDQIYGDALVANEFAVDPAVVNTRLIMIWKQLAERYKDRSPKLMFELLNEPHGRMTGDVWNQMLVQLRWTVRQTNPTRILIAGGGYWSSQKGLAGLKLPTPDRNMIVTFHNYDPMNFTHQGVSYMPQYPAGVTCCTDAQKLEITAMLDTAKAWSVARGYPVYLGEFGSFKTADMASREAYTRFVRDEAEKRGIPWTYWEFGSSFGMFNPTTNQWIEPLRRALLD
jgi:endoglucanase